MSVSSLHEGSQEPDRYRLSDRTHGVEQQTRRSSSVAMANKRDRT
jgi:hypothetical protein